MWCWPWLFVPIRFFEFGGGGGGAGVAAYTHTPCHSRAVRAQFQFPNCYLPPLNPNLLLSQASFLMSHNAGTSYISRRNSFSKTGLSWRYAQNQAPGTAYDQLQNGARALDVRPLLWRNGTVTLQHGSIHIPVTLDTFVQDVRRWCHDHPDELVILLPSHFEYQSESTKFRTSSNTNDDVDDGDDAYFDYQQGEGQWNDDDDGSNLYYTNDATAASSSMTTRIAQILANLGVSYYTCADVYDITVAQAMAMASLLDQESAGYLLVLDGHDYYGTSCAKENWIESQLVTCYNSKNSNVTNQTIPCTRPPHSSNDQDVSWQRLQQYLDASTNNPATDAWNALGPPVSLDQTPFNTIPAYWQVTTAAVVAGVTHGSSILQDNRQSHVNARIVEWVYQSNYNYNKNDGAAAISLLAVDNVALNGNALLSVVRNQCGQQQQPSSSLDDDSSSSVLPCGTALPLPRMTDADWTAQQWIWLVVALLYSIWMVYSVVVYQRPRLLYTLYARGRTAWDEYQQQRQQQQYYQNRKQQDLLAKENEDPQLL